MIAAQLILLSPLTLMPGNSMWPAMTLLALLVELYTRLGENRKNDLILIMTPEKQDKTLELSKHWSPDSTPARNEVTMKTTYPVNQ